MTAADLRIDGRIRQPHRAGERRPRRPRTGLPQARRLLALSHRGPERRAAPAQEQPAAHRAGGRIMGLMAGYLMQYYVTVWQFPINIGGRPLHSWPSYIVITFEMTILFAAGSAVLGLLALCGLPMPYHPVFNAPRFALASRNRFFLCIEAADPLFERGATSAFLQTSSLGR